MVLFSDEAGNQLKQSNAKYLFVAEELFYTAKDAVRRIERKIVGFDSRFYTQFICSLRTKMP